MAMNDVIGLALIYVVFLGALMSPGPDLLITMRNALGYSARAGVFTAAGIGMALIVHFTYCLAGIGLLISQSVLLFNILKWIGAAYLIFVGVQAMRSKGAGEDMSAEEVTKGVSVQGKSDARAFRDGVITNLFNPKATMFFLALFSQMLDPDLPRGIVLGFCAICMCTAFLWFATVSLVMSSPPIRQRYRKASKWIDRVFGGFFMGLGLKLAFTKI